MLTDTPINIQYTLLVVFEFHIVYCLSLQLVTKAMCRKHIPCGKAPKLAVYVTNKFDAAVKKTRNHIDN